MPKKTSTNLRNTKPYSLAPLTPEQALRKLMSAQKLEDEPEVEKPKRAKGEGKKK